MSKNNVLLLSSKNYKIVKVSPNIKVSFFKNFNLNYEYDILSQEIYNINFLLKNVRNSSFKYFFKNLDIDTPEVLNKVKSLKRIKDKSLLNKFSTYLSKNGKKVRSMQQVLRVFQNLILTLQNNETLNSFNSNWRNLYLLLSLNHYFTNKCRNLYDLHNLNVSNNFTIKNSQILKSNLINIDSMLKDRLKKTNLIFSLYIYKVDKQIYKNSRGKSGKYTFIWKYVAPYKRHFLIFHWLVKEIKVTSGKNIKERMEIVFKNFMFDLKKTWVWKIQTFSLNYAYYNLRKTLSETYLTSTR